MLTIFPEQKFVTLSIFSRKKKVREFTMKIFRGENFTSEKI